MPSYLIGLKVSNRVVPISTHIRDILKTQIFIEFKAKKRVTISDYSCSSGNWIHCFTLFRNGPKKKNLLAPTGIYLDFYSTFVS